MNRIIIIAVGIIFLVGSGMRIEHWRMEAKIAAANKKYEDLKNVQQEHVNELTQQFSTRLADVTRDRDAAIASLRNRANRLSEAAKASCKGASGAELSGPDAEFLTRLAARADRLREALTTCYNYADTLQR